jgi:hypothetical protein
VLELCEWTKMRVCDLPVLVLYDPDTGHPHPIPTDYSFWALAPGCCTTPDIQIHTKSDSGDDSSITMEEVGLVCQSCKKTARVMVVR